jgi:hypothetical protein
MADSKPQSRRILGGLVTRRERWGLSLHGSEGVKELFRESLAYFHARILF